VFRRIAVALFILGSILAGVSGIVQRIRDQQDAAMTQESWNDAEDKRKASDEANLKASIAARKKGIQHAKAAIAAGKLRLYSPLSNDFQEDVDQVRLQWKKRGVEYEIITQRADLKTMQGELQGWNDTMEAELKRKFGKDILDDVALEAVDEEWRKSRMAYHRDPAGASQQQDGKKQPKAERKLLVMTWFLRGTAVAVYYDVWPKGEWCTVKESRNWAFMGPYRGQFSDKKLADLRGLLAKLPKSVAKSPTDGSVVVSFERDGKWCTEIYDSSALSETVEKVMLLILGVMSDSLDRERKPR
jgi:hypothetical protein